MINALDQNHLQELSLRKITIVTHEYYPMPGGVAKSAQRIAHLLKASGYEVNVVVIRFGTMTCKEELNDDGVKVHFFDLKTHQTLDQITQDENLFFHCDQEIDEILSKHWQSEPTQIVLNLFVTNTGVPANNSFKRICPNGKFVACLRGNDAGLAPSNKVIASRLSYVLDRSDRIASVAPDLIEIAKAFTKNTEFHLIPNSISIDETFIKRTKHQVPTLASLAIFRRKKGIHHLISALSQVSKEYDFNLLLIGDYLNHFERDLHQDVIRSSKISHKIELTGYLNLAQASKILEERVDMFVAPSLKSEGCPNAVLQAMNKNLPLLTSDAGCLELMNLDGKTGWVCKADNIDSLTEKLTLAFENQDKWVNMGENAKIHLENKFSLSAEQKNWEKLLNNL